ncbi:MAG TPA: 4-hydroxythreonine-4-phosphate dehydrogenase PdxA [Planctomycetaceae bacterium]|nr:4-hydroxythreonine-4-phosphate dehydrogenase PdxA [Planctomycetaceae bacterium]
MNRVSTRKRIGISIGDPAGIGPELALRAAARIEDFPDVDLVLIGDAALLRRVASEVGLPLRATQWIDGWDQVAVNGTKHEATDQGHVSVFSAGDLNADTVIPGQWTAVTGAASYHWVCVAAKAAMAGHLDAMVTGPIQKEAWHAAGIDYPGHTELLAELTSSSQVRMMLTSDELSCVLATVHIPLVDVAAHLSSDDVYEAIELGVIALEKKCRRKFNAAPRVTVCGLNPHAGEHGLMSHQEEEQIIMPAIGRAKAAGYDVTGPLSPDTAFVPARRKITDVYVCMYHDQGLIPLKALSFDDAVNVTLGLPIVRTSVDHGTAMDIAWTGKASESSLMAAIRMASELVK